jgi:hypothetical protein
MLSIIRVHARLADRIIAALPKKQQFFFSAERPPGPCG